MDTEKPFRTAKKTGILICDIPQHAMTPAPSPGRSDDRLESWKAIADYLGKSQTSVRRWEREEGLPVHRQEHLKRGSIVAFKSEIEDWRVRRTLPLPEELLPAKHKRRYWPAAAFACAASGAGLLFAIAVVRPPWDTIRNMPLTAYPGVEAHVTFSPGGHDFAYTKGGYGLVVESPDEPPRQIWRATGQYACCTRWSPDGKWLAVSHSDANHNIETIVVDRSGVRRPGPHIHGGPGFVWRADSSAGLFPRREKGGPAKIFEYRLDTHTITPINEPPPNSWGDIHVSESSDGRNLAIVRYSEMGKGDIFVLRKGETHPRQATHLAAWINGVDWLPDNRTIVFASSVNNQLGLFLIDSASPGSPVPVDQARGEFSDPTATTRPDGSIWVAAQLRQWSMHLTLIDPASKQSPVALSSRNEESPALSETGNLAFQSSRGGGHDLWTCPLPCANPRRLTSNTEPVVAMTPKWSPDESRIAFVARKDGKPSIWSIAADGSDLRLLSTGHDEGSPAWSANGADLFFRSDRSGRSEIWRMPAAGGPATQITNGGGVESVASHDGLYLYYLRANQSADLIRLDLRTQGQSVVKDVPPLTLHRWTISGNLLTFVDPGHSSPAALKQFDLVTGKTRVLVPDGLHRTVGITANRAGAIIYSSTTGRESDIFAFELRRRPFWQLFSKR